MKRVASLLPLIILFTFTAGPLAQTPSGNLALLTPSRPRAMMAFIPSTPVGRSQGLFILDLMGNICLERL